MSATAMSVSTSQSETYTLFCLLVGEDTPFSVEIANNKTVGILDSFVEVMKKPELDLIAADKLKLYKVDIFGSKQEELMKIAGDLDKQDALYPLHKLAKIYPDLPPDETIHILVQLPQPGRKRLGSSLTESEMPPAKKTRTEYEPIIPSSATPRQIRANKTVRENFHYGRPFRSESIPLALLDISFGQFMEDVQTYTPTKADNEFASTLRGEMVELYDNEQGRAAAFRAIWETYIQNSIPEFTLEPAKIAGSEYITDGHFRIGKFCLIITEGKGELTKINADPVLQAGMHYVQSFNSLVKVVEDRFPCLIVYYAGSYIGFAGAIWPLNTQVEVLTPFYPLHTSIHETDVILQVTRAIAASKRAIETLKAHYHALNARVSQSTPDFTKLAFPYRTYYHDHDGSNVEFHYFERPYPTKLIFLAKTKQGPTVFVKFTRKYSAAAHKYCADNGIAPPLHAVEELPGGWLMVVMDYLNEKLYSHLGSVTTNPTQLVAQLRPRVERAVQILHVGGFVHGDLRNVNLMVRKEQVSGEDPGVMVLDFDWAGEQGKVRYPPNVNTQQITRPEGVEDGILIEVAHDEAMVANMFK